MEKMLVFSQEAQGLTAPHFPVNAFVSHLLLERFWRVPLGLAESVCSLGPGPILSPP